MDFLCLHKWLDLASTSHVIYLNVAAAHSMEPSRLTHAVQHIVHRKQDALCSRLSLLHVKCCAAAVAAAGIMSLHGPHEHFRLITLCCHAMQAA